MGVTSYYTVNGEIIGENGPNGRIDYQVDALGSVVGTMNSSGSAQRVYRYKPYGAVLNASGPGSDPLFRWVGTPGYRQTGLGQSDCYVRARHYGSLTARWTSGDPLIDQKALSSRRVHRIGSNSHRPLSSVDALGLYTYGTNRPTVDVDPSGLAVNVCQSPQNGPYYCSGGGGESSPCGGRGTPSCVTVSIPFNDGIINANIALTVCKSCFCCGRTCTSVSLQLCASISLGLSQLVGQLLTEVEAVATQIVIVLDNAIGGVSGFIPPVCGDGCPPAGSSLQGEGSFAGCIAAGSITGTCHFAEGDIVCDGNAGWGLCWPPAVSICIQATLQVCS